MDHYGPIPTGSSKACFTRCSSVSIVNFEQVNAAWDVSMCTSKQASASILPAHQNKETQNQISCT